jgi:hypothetical protein
LNVLIGLEMLNKITILNSKVYGKATIDLQDIDSLQLVGPNNIGKSTLIYALNFLFVIDGQKMSFSGGRKGNKETIDHYLPSLNQSYIIFEISKNATYCVMVKRNAEFDIEYYKIDSSYSDSFFFADEEGKQRLLKFDEVKENFEKSSIALTLFKNKSEVFSTIYQRGRKNDAAVWLEDSVKSDGLSNNFSKIYRYLINSKLITNKTLKESLIIADNRENEIVNFSQKNKKELSDLLRINDEIKNVKSISSEFTQFREMVNLYYGKIDIIGGLKFAFNRQYQTALPELDESILNRETDIRKLVNEINEVLEPQKQELNRKIGQKEFEIQSDFKLAGDKKVILDDIKTFEDAAFLKQQSSNLDKQRKEIEARITTIESQGLSSLQLQGKVLKLDRDVKSLNEQIKNYDNLLIHNISDNADDRKLLNAVFSSQISSLPASQIKKKISKSNKKLLKIFDGEIDLSKGITIAPFKPVEELKEELKEIKAELKATEQLLTIANDIDSANKQLDSLRKQIDLVKEKLRKQKQIPQLEKELDALQTVIQAKQTEKVNIEKELNVLNEKIAKHQHFLESLQDGKRKMEERKITLIQRKQSIEEISIPAEPYESNESLDTIYIKIENLRKEIVDLKYNKDKVFDALKSKTKSAIADEKQFIEYIEDELACLSDKEKSIDGLLASISTQFANPAYQMLKRYDEFKQFINNKFNTKLSQTRISDIESLRIELDDNKRIINELRQISEIQDINGQLMLEFDQTENLKTLNTYLDSARKVYFDELFDISLHLETKGSVKRVDLAQQVESDGTDRMIRLIIIMAIINRLAINTEENKIALFIDEVATIDKQNRPELVNFCKEHHFIPIFAAPDSIPGFNKYYFIYPSKGKININENLHSIVSERNAIA